MSGSLILLSGPRGAGKTTALQKALEQLHSRFMNIAGILSLPVEEDGRKVAIDGLDLSSGERKRLAVRNFGKSGDLITHQWDFDPDAMQWADQVLSDSTPCDLLIVDELGTLEFERGKGWLAGLKALDKGDYRIAIAVIRPELLGIALKRWPKSEQIHILPETRSEAVQMLTRLVDRIS